MASTDSQLKEFSDKEWNVTVFETVDSTNVRLLNDVKSGKASIGTVYIAKSQSEGRGRLGRSFISPVGGLYMSFCVGDMEYALSTVICAVAVAETLEELGFNPRIKWVNDILINGKKICGILAQSAGDGNRAVMGVGINLTSKNIPAELSEIADGLDSFGEVFLTKEDIALRILQHYKALSDTLPDGRESIIARYKDRMLMLGDFVTILQTGAVVRILDVDSTGALITETLEGKILCLNSGEISIRKITTN